MKARHKLLTVFSVLGGLMAIASVGWACTFLVGPTALSDSEPTPPSEGGEISAVGSALHAREPVECNSSPCDYELITANDPAAYSCHYNDGEEAYKSDATESQPAPGVTKLSGTVTVPSGNDARQAVACFRSKETFEDDDAPAAGTSGAPFVVLD
jgi:hypothetical protein